MNKNEAIREDIEKNAEEIVVGIKKYKGRRVSYEDGGGLHETKSASLVLCTCLPSHSSSLSWSLAYARQVALAELKMVSASVLVVSEEFRKKNWREFLQLETDGEDGRIFGMNLKKYSGMLPSGALYMIMDPAQAEEEEERKEDPRERGQRKNRLIEAMEDTRGLFQKLDIK